MSVQEQDVAPAGEASPLFLVAGESFPPGLKKRKKKKKKRSQLFDRKHPVLFL